MSIDSTLLISLIEERPALWDKTTECYKNKKLKYDAWENLFSQLDPSYEDLSTIERTQFGQMVMKKWTNMKDNWIKYNKKNSECLTASGTKKIRKYLFYDEMFFLKKIVDHRQNESSMNEDTDSSLNLNIESCQGTSEDPQTDPERPNKNKKPKKELNEVDMKFMNFMDSTIEKSRSRSMNFFKGIADIVDKFSDEDMIDFQFQVISTIKMIQQKNQWNQDS